MTPSEGLTRRALLAGAPAVLAAARRPNVLWLMTDEHRCDSIGAYGSAWAETPALDELARGGTLFHNAVTPSPVCVPARLSLLTGRYPSHTGVQCNSDRPKPDEKFLIDAFRRAGYQTCGVGKQHYNSGQKLFDTQINRMLSDAVHYVEYRKGRSHRDYDGVRYPRDPFHWILAGRFPEDESRTSSALDVTDALAWCKKVDKSRPFLLRVSFNDPHTPVVPPAPYDTAIDPAKIRIPGPSKLPAGAPEWETEGLASIESAEPLSANEIARMRQCYYGLVKFLDRQVGRLLDGMRRLELLENTIIALVADHGTHLGDYGLLQKSTFYNPVVNVPFLFVWPGEIRAGVTMKQPVETISLVPTLLELCGVDRPASVEALTLTRCLRSGREPDPRPVFSDIRHDFWRSTRVTMVRDGRWKLSVATREGEDAGAALYDLHNDPQERNNIAGSVQHEAVSIRLRKLLERYRSAA